MPPSGQPGITIEDLFRELFAYSDISFENASFFRWMAIDDRLIPRPIQTIPDLIQQFHDGRYHLHLTKVSINGLEGGDLDIENLDAELIFEDGKWTDHWVFTDEETFWPEIKGKSEDLPSALTLRFDGITERIMKVLNLLRTVFGIIERLD